MVQVDTTDKINYTWLRNKREMVSSESDLEIAIHNSTRLMTIGKNCKLSKGILRTIISFKFALWMIGDLKITCSHIVGVEVTNLVLVIS